MKARLNKLFRPGKALASAQPLAIDGVPPATLTPEPDDAELAAEALLEMMAGERRTRKAPVQKNEPTKGTLAYYRRLADRIYDSHISERRSTERYLAYCEQELGKPTIPIEKAEGLEKELYRRLNIVEREDGKLKRRWQHCLADVIIKLTVKKENE